MAVTLLKRSHRSFSCPFQSIRMQKSLSIEESPARKHSASPCGLFWGHGEAGVNVCWDLKWEQSGWIEGGVSSPDTDGSCN